MHKPITLAAIAVAQALSLPVVAQVIISEYVEGSSNNKAVELVNLGSTAVDLSGYTLELYANGSTTALSPAISLSGTLAPAALHVIAHTSANDALKAKADSLKALNYNGDDALVLKANGTVVDSLGRVGERPISAWTSGSVSTVNMTLRRKSSITTGDTLVDDAFDVALSYDAYPIDDFSDLGLYNGVGGGGSVEPPYAHGNCGDAVTLISAVQGSGMASPLVGTTLSVEGIVTAAMPGSAGLGGFYLQQDPARYDADASTSEGMFIANSLTTEVQPGQFVRVSGVVEESYGQTQLGKLEAISSCGTATVPDAVAISLPQTSANSFEALEGMLVRTSQSLVISDNYGLGRYNEVTLSSKRLMTPTQVAAPGDAAKAVQAANALDRLVLDDGSNLQNIDQPYPAPGLTASNTLRTGDQVQPLTAVLGYGFSAYRLFPVSTLTFEAKNLRTEHPVFSQEGDFRLASFNVLNYFNGDGQGGGFPTSRGASTAVEFDKQRSKIIAALTALNADIVGLLEIENDGFGEFSALADLVKGLNDKAGAEQWAYVAVDAEQIGTDAITSAIIYRKDKVEETGTAAFTTAEPFHYGNRPPLAQSFRHKVSAQTIQLVVAHLRSKGSCPNAQTDAANADSGDGQGCWNAYRVLAAQQLSQWLSGNPTQATLAQGQSAASLPTLLLGDINAYLQEDPIHAFADAGFTELSQAFHGTNQYSYSYDGEAGSLDHAFANAALQDLVADITEWHINADEPTILDYNEEYKSEQAKANFFAPTPYRSSDHDPLVVAVRYVRPQVSAQHFVISENAGANTLVGTVQANALRPVVAYQLSGPAASWFSLSPAGELRLTAQANPDFETAPVLSLTVVAEQEGGVTSEPVQITVNLTNEAELPLINFTQHLTTVEQDKVATIASFTTSVLGEGATVKSVTLNGGAQLLAVGDVQSTGAADIITAEGMDAGQYELVLTVTDSLGASSSVSFNLEVTAKKDSGSMPLLWTTLLGLLAFRRRKA